MYVLLCIGAAGLATWWLVLSSRRVVQAAAFSPQRIHLSRYTKRLILGLFALAGLLTLPPLTAACDSDRPHAEGEIEHRAKAELSTRDRYSFMAYLDTHWETARLLYEQPELINDRQFLHTHSALQDWLTAHPKAAEVIQANPYRVLWEQDMAYQRATDTLSSDDVRSLDPCLDTHWEEADALYRNPELINNTWLRARLSMSTRTRRGTVQPPVATARARLPR